MTDAAPSAVTVTRLLITGSRDATPAMLDMARHAVARAKANGWEIVVGDAPGVDTAVVDACKEFEVFGECYGITERPRCNITGNNYVSYIWISRTIEYGRRDVHVYQGATYLERDRQMVQVANRCFAICLNRSRGTMYTYNSAVQRGIPADVRHFR
jgi:hypothetical protein